MNTALKVDEIEADEAVANAVHMEPYGFFGDHGTESDVRSKGRVINMRGSWRRLTPNAVFKLLHSKVTSKLLGSV